MTHSCTVERSYMCMCVLCDVMREVWERFVCVGRASFRHLSHVVLQVAIHQAVCLKVTRHGLEWVIHPAQLLLAIRQAQYPEAIRRPSQLVFLSLSQPSILHRLSQPAIHNLNQVGFLRQLSRTDIQPPGYPGSYPPPGGAYGNPSPQYFPRWHLSFDRLRWIYSHR